MRLLALLLAGCGQVGMDATIDTDTRGWISFDPDGEVAFGMVSPMAETARQRVSVVANGDGAVEVEDAWVESDVRHIFYLESDPPFPKAMEPGESVPVDILFGPSERGSFHGTLVIQMGDGNTKELNITGSGCSDGDRDGECSP